MNKKAQSGGYLVYFLIGIVIVIIFALVAVPVSYMGDKIFDELKEDQNFGESNKSVERINQVQSLMTPAFDQLVFIVLVAVALGAIVITLFTQFHPVTVMIFIVATILLVIIGGLFANVHDEVGSTEILSEKSAQFSMTNLVLGSHLPIIILVVGVVCILILLAKRGSTANV